ncbi:MAG: prepilin-type N-terminal cleavage/methylation domain-containing protein [Anaerotignum propionicum]|uniref:type II secretion system protein n=1 Tax=Anaerotignum propionicum TaxID=28446 RepID=UPI002B209D1D|nr:prepilin-type N-terminal cleavage/methylation domain-containing protein [Anaerotignum propionicum]MEA5057396.1 prepilin-type N-terminal cleavage/methylation domain-containing protein [Anaerotignum propionicum]
MMKILKRKNKKGFTLMEMLIVIGIIAILVAIAIPTFTGALNRARYSADVANVRSWYAEELINFMNDPTDTPATAANTAAYVAAGGEALQLASASVTSNYNATTGVFTVTYDSGNDDFEDMTFTS